MTPADRRRFVIEHTTIGSAPLVPEVLLHIGGSSMALWEAAALADVRPAVPPPYWAWPWPGGQALARYLLDRPTPVRGLSVVDVGAGGGIVAIAAALAGAEAVGAIDVAPFRTRGLPTQCRPQPGGDRANRNRSDRLRRRLGRRARRRHLVRARARGADGPLAAGHGGSRRTGADRGPRPKQSPRVGPGRAGSLLV